MDSPGFFTLGDFAITSAGTYAPDEGAELTGLDGAVSATVRLAFGYGSGSGSPSGKAYLQTSLDQANEGGAPSGSWIDIACVTFDTASKVWAFNFSALTPKTAPVTPSDAALAGDTAIDGILGDRLRLMVVTLGTYANTAFSGSVVVR